MRLMGAAIAAIAIGSVSPVPAAVQAPDVEETDRALDLLKTIVDYPTEQGKGQVPKLATYLSGLFQKGGFKADDIVITPVGETAVMTVRYAGSDPGLKPIVISDHLDVVAADPKDWVRDPFHAVVEKGYAYGRGVDDNKFDVAMVTTTLLQMKREGYVPRRTIIFALSGDEETAMLSTQVLSNRLKGAELVLNGDGGGGVLDDRSGAPVVYGLQAGEKTYADFEIAFTSPGGHSSRPGPASDNAIYRLAKALDRIGVYQFPVHSNELTISFLKASAKKTPGAVGQAMARFAANPGNAAAAETLSAQPAYVGQLRTTCVATMLSGGHAQNALPQRAAANVNCRIFPGTPIADVAATLKQVVADRGAIVTTMGKPASSEASPMRADVTAAVRKAIDLRAPGLEIVPKMDVGASDSLYFRAVGVPSYGVSSVFEKPSDDFAHGLNERVQTAIIPGALVQWHSMLTDLSAK